MASDNEDNPGPRGEFLPPVPPPNNLATQKISELRLLIAGRLIDLHSFDEAAARAEVQGVPLDVLLIMEGLVDETALCRALADSAETAFIEPELAGEILVQWEQRALYHNHDQAYMVLTVDGYALVPTGLSPSAVRAELLAIQQSQMDGTDDRGQGQPFSQPPRVRLTSNAAVRRAFLARYSQNALKIARDGLFEKTPELSARGGLIRAQIIGLAVLSILTVFGFWRLPGEAAFVVSMFFAVFFLMLISLRFMAALLQVRLGLKLALSQNRDATDRVADEALPIYTLLVPLYKEAHMLPQLVSALTRLDYPKAKLDIKLLLEEVDLATVEAARAMGLPGCFDIIVVPDGSPRTKPKALNYGLQFAKGDFVVIYDAEDIPEPNQLRQALDVFASSGPRLATVQAKLNFYNPRQNWLTRQFTVEYGSLFDGLLPSYQYLGFPIPLGGTSNHFRREVLESAGAWDPYNVTEDADLGMRLYRQDYYSTILLSTTYEEACSGFKDWLYQRTRWLKGWMQTYYVHMRHPIKLLRELGLWKFLGFQAIIGGPIFSAFAHPLFLGLLLWQVPRHELPVDVPLIALWALALFNLSFGYIATMWLGVVALRYRGLTGFAFAILTLPLYWLLISLAAYRAMIQLIHAPFRWEKTHHKGQDVSQ